MYSVRSATDLKFQIQKDIEKSERLIGVHLRKISNNWETLLNSKKLSQNMSKKIRRTLERNEDSLHHLKLELSQRLQDYDATRQRLCKSDDEAILRVTEKMGKLDEVKITPVSVKSNLREKLMDPVHKRVNEIRKVEKEILRLQKELDMLQKMLPPMEEDLALTKQRVESKIERETARTIEQFPVRQQEKRKKLEEELKGYQSTIEARAPIFEECEGLKSQVHQIIERLSTRSPSVEFDPPSLCVFRKVLD